MTLHHNLSIWDNLNHSKDCKCCLICILSYKKYCKVNKKTLKGNLKFHRLELKFEWFLMIGLVEICILWDRIWNLCMKELRNLDCLGKIGNFWLRWRESHWGMWRLREFDLLLWRLRLLKGILGLVGGMSRFLLLLNGGRKQIWLSLMIGLWAGWDCLNRVLGC